MRLKLNPHKYEMPTRKFMPQDGKKAPHFHGRSSLWWTLCYHGFLKVLWWMFEDYFKYYRPNIEEFKKINKEYENDRRKKRK